MTAAIEEGAERELDAFLKPTTTDSHDLTGSADEAAARRQIADLFPGEVSGFIGVARGTPTAGADYLPDFNTVDYFELTGNENREAVTDDIIACIRDLAAAGKEVYLSAAVLTTDRRKAWALKETHVIRGDWDGAPDDRDECLRRVEKLGGSALNSGRPGHLHIAVPLADPITTVGQYQHWWARLAAYLPAGLDKKNPVDVLRIVGITSNFKQTIADIPGQPVPITWALEPTGERLTLADLAERLGADADADDHGPQTPAAGSEQRPWGEETALDIVAHPSAPALRAALVNPVLKSDGSGDVDRSETTYQLVRTAVFCGLNDNQIRTYLRMRVDVAERLDRRGPVSAETDFQNCRAQAFAAFHQAWVDVHEHAQLFATGRQQTNTGAGNGRMLDLIAAGDIEDGIPTWAWEYDGAGRLQLHTVALFGGRPGAGKSTGARWFAAQWTLGNLDGIWKGQPQNVAYIATEEPLEYVVKPGLKAAGADMSRVVFPRITHDGNETSLIAADDEKQLIAALAAAGVRIVIVDPIMSTIGRKVDIHRSNETREALAPWLRIAKAIGGIVLGVVHLNKAKNTDVVGAINGSSAFGEVARCIFAFVKDDESDDGDRIMSQIKNSCGREDLSLTYKIAGQPVTTERDGEGTMPVFVLGGHSERSVEDVMSTAGHAAHGHVSRAKQQIVDFVNSRDSTEAGDLVTAGLATTQKGASQKLKRAADDGLIDNPWHGIYTRNAPPVPPAEGTRWP